MKAKRLLLNKRVRMLSKSCVYEVEMCRNALDLVVLFGLLHGNFDLFDYPLSKIHFRFLFFTDSQCSRVASCESLRVFSFTGDASTRE